MERPTCCDRPMRLHTKTAAGSQRYRCPFCQRTLTKGGTHGGYRHGKPGGTPAAERMRQTRERRRKDSTGDRE